MLASGQKWQEGIGVALTYLYTTGLFAFYINATSTPEQKNNSRAHSRALGIRPV